MAKKPVVKESLRAGKPTFVTGFCPNCHQLTTLIFFKDEPADQWHCLACGETWKDIEREHEIYDGCWLIEYWDSEKAFRKRQRTIVNFNDLFDFIGTKANTIIAIVNLRNMAVKPLVK